MANPWDPLPFPNQGDTRINKTFRYVGLVVTAWESGEFELARLHSVLVEDPDGASLQELYGAGNIFRDRLSALRREFDRYRVSLCCQYREGEFDYLTAAAEGFSNRRHEVAHGLVIRADRLSPRSLNPGTATSRNSYFCPRSTRCDGMMAACRSMRIRQSN